MTCSTSLPLSPPCAPPTCSISSTTPSCYPTARPPGTTSSWHLEPSGLSFSSTGKNSCTSPANTLRSLGGPCVLPTTAPTPSPP
eukprot:1455253-Rhodomonas_salina.1